MLLGSSLRNEHCLMHSKESEDDMVDDNDEDEPTEDHLKFLADAVSGIPSH